ncbi:short-subunit dehydrogenase [Enterobacter sp. BIGb0383]|uniref:SDR family NAD(P)-dependent oxidoreductase n=1 Tax=unclassified Enterobacter TaxID=2608935 RepID=UPI000F4A44F1|nr:MULTISPECIES: SDR family oxidoreductase [unclassified Enterobacter]ROP59721.1 short-subunit dehydrogenase [Enterobacter sp. BIGb0383]ROS08810.1 short-subunit dehydrogenase [Enterobacter sp. BIGb0359]
MSDSVISKGRVAVITGAARGIGAAMARRFSEEGMRLSLFDRDKAALELLVKELKTETLCTVGDVSREDDLQRFYARTAEAFDEVALLVNNAGVNTGAGPWDPPAAWRNHLQTNLLSAVTLQHLFVPHMLAQTSQAAIVNLGSKEGITTPPGNAAYSVGKAGIKVLTEQLANELRNVAGDRVTAHLLVPGYTWTPMNFPGMDERKDSQPQAAWTSGQVVNHFMDSFRRGDFYILCPDNEVTPEMDRKRILWAAQDLIDNRPALSRWHPQWEAHFAAWMKG